MIDLPHLWTTRRPWLHILHDDVDVEDLSNSAPVRPSVVVEFDGAKMKDVEELFREFVREFRLPEYFGWNWPAFAECMGDLQWAPARAYLVLVARPELLLCRSPADRETFFRIINDACSRWANSFGRGPEWGGGEVPFNVGLLCNSSTEETVRKVVGSYL